MDILKKQHCQFGFQRHLLRVVEEVEIQQAAITDPPMPQPTTSKVGLFKKDHSLQEQR
jgi:hypothetical protein